jgi:hypothetical protein
MHLGAGCDDGTVSDPARVLQPAWRILLLTISLLAAACFVRGAPAALAATTIEPTGCCGSATVASYGGWAAWSRLDTSSGQYELVVRAPGGTASTPAVPERAAPFDVQIGPTPGGPAAVYSRCSDSRGLQGCSLRELVLSASPVEKLLSPPIGGSLHEPAIWEGQIAFLRRHGTGSEDPNHPGARPDALYTWRIGSGKVASQKLAASKGSRGDVSWPKGLTGVISGLTIGSGWIAYVTETSGGGTFALSTLWAQRPGQGPRLIDQVTGGAGNVCPPQFLSPSLSGQRVTAYLHACAPSNSVLDRWTRYGLTSRSTERATTRFLAAPDEEIFSVLPLGGGAIWSDGAILTTGSVKWKPISRPSPESFCSHSDLIC